MLRTTVIAGFALFMGAMVATAESTNPDVMARQGLMGTIGKNTKILGDMAGGKTDFDASAAAAAKSALAAAAAEIPVKFETNVDDPESEVKANIWTDWEKFMADGKALEVAANAIDVASLDGVKAGMGAIGGACKACHQEFRAKK
jgi:cytochrome c556